MGRLPRKIGNNIKTVDQWYYCGDVKPILSDLHPFGCLCFAHMPIPHRAAYQTLSGSPTAQRGQPCIHLGPWNFAYRLLDPITGKIFQASCVIFDDLSFGEKIYKEALVKCCLDHLAYKPIFAPSVIPPPSIRNPPPLLSQPAPTAPSNPDFLPPESNNHDENANFWLAPDPPPVRVDPPRIRPVSSSQPSPSSHVPVRPSQPVPAAPSDLGPSLNPEPVFPGSEPPQPRRRGRPRGSGRGRGRSNASSNMSSVESTVNKALREYASYFSKIIKPISHMSPVEWYLSNASVLTSFEKMTPKHYTAATRCPEKHMWKEAMEKEINVFKKYNVYELVPPDHPNQSGRECYILNALWRFRIKTRDGKVEKYKARLCANGAQMKNQISARQLDLEADLALTHDRITSPSADIITTRLMFILAASLNLKLYSGDLPSAYLQAPIDNDKYAIYLKQPEGFVDVDRHDWLWRLSKAVYGLLNAGYLWYIEFTSCLMSIGFSRCEHEPCLFILRKETDFMVFKINTDDNLHFSTCETLRTSVIKKLSQKFGYTDEGICNHHLGITIVQTDEFISASQRAPIEELVEEFHDVNKRNVPMRPYAPSNNPLNLGNNPDQLGSHGPHATALIRTEGSYRSVLGKLRYLTTTRPDIEFPLNYLCRYQDKPIEEHYLRALDILGYLKKFPDLPMCYPKNLAPRYVPPLHITAKIDESNADCKETLQSTYGFIIYVDDMPIAWKSRRIPFVTQGTGSTAFVAMNFAAIETRFCKHLLEFLGFSQHCPMDVYTDNLPASQAVRSVNTTPLTRALDLKYFYIREQFRNSVINVEWISRDDNEADMLTRPLQQNELTRQRRRLLCDVPQPKES